MGSRSRSSQQAIECQEATRRPPLLCISLFSFAVSSRSLEQGEGLHPAWGGALGRSPSVGCFLAASPTLQLPTVHPRPVGGNGFPRMGKGQTGSWGWTPHWPRGLQEPAAQRGERRASAPSFTFPLAHVQSAFFQAGTGISLSSCLSSEAVFKKGGEPKFPSPSTLEGAPCQGPCRLWLESDAVCQGRRAAPFGGGELRQAADPCPAHPRSFCCLLPPPKDQLAAGAPSLLRNLERLVRSRLCGNFVPLIALAGSGRPAGARPWNATWKVAKLCLLPPHMRAPCWHQHGLQRIWVLGTRDTW
ncbi:uncharacterized protein LOC103062264 [Python bivittatus]|uniref:Uncharacterized protein LOC103062264 n=1 Tax=Python bivittatus TaxID=176946 RepID=A0A9F5J3P1_PYTBI|nr:uncharacterized protein LOC103062264 [Python bivittatus]